MSLEKIRILLVEDEILYAQDVRNRLSNSYDVIGIASSADQAAEILRSDQNVDLVLLDIGLDGDKDGIDLAYLINEEFKIPFIFLTSHANSAFIERAKKAKPAAYLLKPFNDREVPIAIELALYNYAEQPKEPVFNGRKTNLKDDHEVMNINDRLFLKKENHFKRVALKDIYFLEADGNYTTIYTSTDRFIYSAILRKIEEKLPRDQFIRVHRSYLINIDAVDGFEGNALFISQNRIPVSKQYREVTFKLFNAF